MRKPTYVGLSLFLLISLALASLAWPQEPAGVVTALQGQAQRTRPPTLAPVSLRFKDGLLIRDIVETQEKSLARILFGGKSTVTLRELSRLEVREELLPAGAVRSVQELSSGAVLVNVARQLLRPGDEVQIRTPNVVAAVRGTTIIVQYNPALAQSILTVLAGSALVTPQVQPPLTLGPNTTTNITGTAATGVQVGPIQTVGQAQATQLLQQYEARATVKEEPTQQQASLAQLQTATELATAMVETGAPPPPAVEQAVATQPTEPLAETDVTTAPTQPTTGTSVEEPHPAPPSEPDVEQPPPEPVVEEPPPPLEPDPRRRCRRLPCPRPPRQPSASPGISLDRVVVSDPTLTAQRKAFGFPVPLAQSLQRQVHSGSLTLDKFYRRPERAMQDFPWQR